MFEVQPRPPDRGRGSTGGVSGMQGDLRQTKSREFAETVLREEVKGRLRIFGSSQEDLASALDKDTGTCAGEKNHRRRLGFIDSKYSIVV